MREEKSTLQGACIASYLAIAMTGYGMWQEWWIATGFYWVGVDEDATYARVIAQKSSSERFSARKVGSIPAFSNKGSGAMPSVFQARAQHFASLAKGGCGDFFQVGVDQRPQAESWG